LKRLFATTLLLLSSIICALAQPRDFTNQLLQIKSSSDSLIKNFPAEKLYLQTDKPNYAVGDTLWFKAYLFHAPTLGLSAKSGIMYIDIANDSNKVVKQMRFPVDQELSWGNISLTDFPAGNYNLRAYTEWMLNFGEDCFFYKRFAVIGEKSGIVSIGTLQQSVASKQKEPSDKMISLTETEDSIKVSVSANNQLKTAGESYLLICKARGIICYAAVVNFNGDSAVKRNISKSLFPSGITHFVLTDTRGHHLDEQLIFIDRHDQLHIAIQTNKTGYALRDSVAIHLKVTNKNGNPVKSNFSIAVTDDGQIKIDSLQDNIVSHSWLTSEFKGYLNNPGYYLRKENSVAISNLLSARGAVNYDWPVNIHKPVFRSEKELAVSGRVLNGFNAAVKSTKVILLSKSPFILRDTITDKGGSFSFQNFPRIDTPVFFIKATNRHDKSFNVGIIIDEIKPPDWHSYSLYRSADTTIDTGLVTAAKNNRITKERGYLAPNGHLLREVKITAQKVVKDSKKLNGAGNADLTLDEKDMLKAGKKTLLDILYERIGGFRSAPMVAESLNLRFAVQGKSLNDISAEANLPQLYHSVIFMWYFVVDKPVVFVIDGVTLTSSLNALDLSVPNIDDLTNYLRSINAENVKGIELISSTKYSSAYFDRYILSDWHPYLSYYNFAFIEITTRSGKGPFVATNTPGTYLYKPLAISRPDQFFSAHYPLSDIGKRLPDIRSTIYWNPNINIDEKGEATLSFYTADKPGTYTLVIEGTDFNGNLGYRSGKIIVEQPDQSSKK